MSKSENYTNAILEDINSKFDAVLEIVTPLVTLPEQVRRLQSEVDAIRTDIKTMGFVVKDHSGQLRTHDGRLLNLETA